MVRHTNFQYQAAKQTVLYSLTQMTPEARPIEFTNGSAHFCTKKKVDRPTQIIIYSAFSYCSKFSFSSWYLAQVTQEMTILFSSTSWMETVLYSQMFYAIFIHYFGWKHSYWWAALRLKFVTLDSHGASASTLDGGRVWSLVLTRRHSDNSQSHTFLVLHEWDWLASALGYLHKAIWLADASVGTWKVEKFSTSAVSSASEATRRDGPTIQFGNAWRHSIQSQREVLTPTPRVKGA